IRLEGRLRVETSVDERWLDIRLPKMTVQPIIENAVKYGLESLKRQGVLKLYTLEVGDVLKIIVEDNGNGMNAERLAWLKQSLNRQIPKESGTGSSGIGLQNLHRRIQHMFGERYGLEIESVPDEGTKVAVMLPLPMEGDVSK
ncbi:MAG: two-component sensor histidine kinase, partial [Paenibacillaceae bacterium]|nr:two-component sensor histidine kinase [Paenibacillaceae bacterium]